MAFVSKAVVGCGSSFDEATCKSWMQYNALYAQRFARLREPVLAEAKCLWSGEVKTEGFLEEIGLYRHGLKQQVVLIGVVFRKMQERPDVIEAYRVDRTVVGSLTEEGISTSQRFCSNKDEFWLEDGTARVKLLLPKDYVRTLCTGLVVAVRGVTTDSGDFVGSAVCFSQSPAVPILPEVSDEPHYVAFMSGLAIDGVQESPALKQAVNFLCRGVQDEKERKIASSIQQLVICGGLFAGLHGSSWRPTKNALVACDDTLSQLAAALPVDVMPGQYDPTNLSLPQTALLPHLFPRARGSQNTRFARNPYHRNLGAVSVLGHSGQPVKDVLRCTEIPDAMSALGMALETLHLAPTAPDTLAMPPFSETDPFILSSLPHILFSGNHDKVQHEWRACARGGSGTQCVCVPAFHQVPAVVLVNLKNTKDVQVKMFDGMHQ